MAWIQDEEGERVGIFIDGYIPDIETLKDLKRRRLLHLGKEIEESPNAFFENLLLFETKNFHKRIQEDKGIFPDLCDLYLFKFECPENRAPPEILPVLKELRHDTSPNYHQVLFTYDERDCKYGKKCIKNVLYALDFKIKKPKEYLDFDSYKNACLTLLDIVLLTPYIAPNIVTEERMSYFGFKGGNL